MCVTVTVSVCVFQIRCMILNTMLLCCAAYEGDKLVVMQLLNNSQASTNGLGLKWVLLHVINMSCDVI